MIIINKFGFLKYKDLKFKCALGKAGIGKKKLEGQFKLQSIFSPHPKTKQVCHARCVLVLPLPIDNLTLLTNLHIHR